uniref:Peptidase S1 domain-containing protein n=1 Tax=Varanus komodoensis TaxID=61221 RepID=A0A8D2LC03_VARKO
MSLWPPGTVGTAPVTLSLALLAFPASGCGQPTYSPVKRVVNGEDAIPHSWPWQVSLQYQAGSEFYHLCGGTLIGPSWVMTAAHCILSGFSYRVVLGEHDLGTVEGTEQNFPVDSSNIFVHPGWNENCVSCGDDIALIKLSGTAALNDKVQLGCLPPPGELLPNWFPCYITGWGSLYTGGSIPFILQQALLPVVDYEHCSQPNWWGTTVSRSMVCAGGDIRAGCNGDSGGPLSCQAADGRWYVHGIASFVSIMGCDTPEKPTVFTPFGRVHAHIHGTNCANNLPPQSYWAAKQLLTAWRRLGHSRPGGSSLWLRRECWSPRLS